MEGDSIKVRTLYQHRSGKVFFMHGMAKDDEKRLVCIISSIDTGASFTRLISKFEGEDPDFLPCKPA